MMKKSIFNILAVMACLSTLISSAYAHAGNIDGSSVIGGAIGGGAGAAVGSSIGGRNGAILGSAVGAAAGVAIASPQPATRVVEHRYYEDRDYHDNGWHRGQHKHHHDD